MYGLLHFTIDTGDVASLMAALVSLLAAGAAWYTAMQTKRSTDALLESVNMQKPALVLHLSGVEYVAAGDKFVLHLTLINHSHAETNLFPPMLFDAFRNTSLFLEDGVPKNKIELDEIIAQKVNLEPTDHTRIPGSSVMLYELHVKRADLPDADSNSVAVYLCSQNGFMCVSKPALITWGEQSQKPDIFIPQSN